MVYSEQKFVLLVEDEEIVAHVFTRVFEAHPEFLLDVATTPSEAIAKLNVFSYHVMFLDMSFAGQSMAGLSVIREMNQLVRKSQQEWRGVLTTRAIIMSGSVDVGQIHFEAPDLQPIEFIAKPVPFDETFVERILQRIGFAAAPTRRSV